MAALGASKVAIKEPALPVDAAIANETVVIYKYGGSG
jgi:hypothetical protein